MNKPLVPLAVLPLLAIAAAQAPTDASLRDLGSGVVRVETKSYTLEVPKGWTVGRETPWGARDMSPAKGGGKLGAMTAASSEATWDQLYRTSLYFILREEPGTPTPYRLGKAPQGYDSLSFEVADGSGFANRRYVLLKSKSKSLLALSVKIPSKAEEKEYRRAFDRMVASARFVSDSDR